MKTYLEDLKESNILKIKASSSEFYLDEEIQLIALKESLHGINEIKNVTWKIDYKGKDIKLYKNIIKISSTLKDITSLKVSCIDKETNEVAIREFDIILKVKKEPLLHFIKNDGDYYGEGYVWDIWNFNKDGEVNSIELNKESDFGRCAFVDKESVILRRRAFFKNGGNDWSEQTPTFNIDKNSKNIYIIYGVNKLITNIEEVIEYIKPRIEVAILDKKDKITAFISKEPLDITEFFIYVNGEKKENISYRIDKKLKKVEFYNLNIDFSLDDLIEVRASNTFLSCKVILRDYLDKYYYEKDDLGATYDDENISLKIWAPVSFKVCVAIYDNWYDTKEKACYAMIKDNDTGVFYTKIDKKENINKYYLYKLYFRDLDSKGEYFEKINYVVDPYAKSVGINGEKGFLIDINEESTMPKNFLSSKRPILLKKEDSIIYEMHIRDFTIYENSGVLKENRGKYLGVVEGDTTYKDEKRKIKISTGLDHLKELGITHVQVLPIFDFGTVDERKVNKKGNRNWGYDPKNYNAPEGSYCSDSYNPILRILELREMITKLHENNIRVIMDVVYNHMQDTKNLDRIIKGYYFRTNNKGRLTNGSGCGNELASERPMVRKLILDSIKNWLINYKVDGFRFDLMELIDLDTIKEVVKITESINDNILVYGEPWRGGDSPLLNGTYKGKQRNEKFSVFNDTFRDFIRGNNSPSSGFVNGRAHDGPTAWNIIEGLKGSINTLTVYPYESINYIDAHDNYTIWDQIEKSLNLNIKEFRNIKEKNILENELVRRNVLALAIILFSQGIPFIQGGAELLRSKRGDSNSYKSPDYINAFYWEDKIKYYDVFKYIKGLIDIRRKFNAFKLKTKEEIMKNTDINFLNGDERVGVIKWHFKNADKIDKDINELIIIFNGTSIDEYDINNHIHDSKTGYWNIIANDKVAGVDVISKVKSFNLPKLKSCSILIFFN